MIYTSLGEKVDGDYRLILWREWRDLSSHDDANWWLGPKNKWLPRPVAFIMLNPSTADGEEDDPTVRKCVKFAARWKFERMEIVNLFSFRSKSPEYMKLNMVEDHRNNASVILNVATRASLVVCAWGQHGRFMGKDYEVLKMLREHDIPERKLKALAINSDGTPKHPLYCKDDSQLMPMRWMI